MIVLRQLRNLFWAASFAAIAGLLLAGGTFAHIDVIHDHDHGHHSQSAAHDHEYPVSPADGAGGGAEIHCGADIIIDVFKLGDHGNRAVPAYHPADIRSIERLASFIEPPPPKHLS